VSHEAVSKLVWSEYASAIKKNEFLSFAGKWMEVEIIMLGNISQTLNKYCMFSLISDSRYFKKYTNVKGDLFVVGGTSRTGEGERRS
jgi:hypothetical protein